LDASGGDIFAKKKIADTPIVFSLLFRKNILGVRG